MTASTQPDTSSPAAARPPEPLLEVVDLVKHFPIKKGVFSRAVGQVKAVDGVSFTVGKGETVGLVGESGCGKTTVGRTLLKLIPPTSGEVRFEGRDVFSLEAAELREMRRKMQIIFQDPYGSLNPRMTVGAIVREGLDIHKIGRPAERDERARYLIDRVGLNPKIHMSRYPHEFSGGQRQRIGIARALSVDPSFIVCDEAVSALDVSIQAQVINLLLELKDEFDLSYLFIAHDLAVVEHISDRVLVMYLGRVVEEAHSKELYKDPRHPYSRALLEAIPNPDPRKKPQRQLLEGDVPSPIRPPSGCRFHTRCPAVMERCSEESPPAYSISETHRSFCFLEEDRNRD